MIKNYSTYASPSTSKEWMDNSINGRIDLINNYLKVNNLDKDFLAIDASDNGQVVLRVYKSLPVNERGLFFINLEEKIKLNIDKGITLWCESVGDRSTLRNLRGVKISL